eukprot:GHVU01009462.1.p3 GENE.GHVU01009462.1~~GHVU01009462.1.p3  ORF type:complete len:126 (-),score=4.89 GHVU01009462.1:140-517(-)
MHAYADRCLCANTPLSRGSQLRPPPLPLPRPNCFQHHLFSRPHPLIVARFVIPSLPRSVLVPVPETYEESYSWTGCTSMTREQPCVHHYVHTQQGGEEETQYDCSSDGSRATHAVPTDSLRTTVP